MNQSCYALLENKQRQYYFFLCLKYIVNVIKQNAHGSVFSTITVDTFKGINLPVPNDDHLINTFEKLVSPLFELNWKQSMENQSLINTRDSLLPKLMSGEIRVPV